MSDLEVDESESADSEVLQDLFQVYNDLLEGSQSANELNDNSLIQQINAALTAKKNQFKSRTSHFWLQYDDLLLILRKSLKADRTGNWLLGLEAF